MNFKNVTAGLCAAVMALSILPAMPIEVQAANIPVVNAYAPHVNSSKFPHATGSPIDAKMLSSSCFDMSMGKVLLNKKLTVSKEAYPGWGGTPINPDNTVFIVLSDGNGTIYSKNGGGVFAPEDSSRLFSSMLFNGRGGIHATSYDFSGLDTSKVTNMNSMFQYSKATSLDLSSFDTSKVTDMTSMFLESPATSLDLSNFDTSNVTNMSNMFYNTAATSLNLSNFNTSKVESMNSMFQYSKATSLDLSNFDTGNVFDMENMFSNSAATSLDLSSFDTSKVYSMMNMFYLSKATSLDLSSFDTSQVVNMRMMFRSSAATNITGLSNFNTSKVSNMSSMFQKSAATNLDLSSFDTSKVSNMADMFASSAATSITGLSSFNTGTVYTMKNMFYDSAATSLDLSSFDVSNVDIVSDMFANSKATDVLCRTSEDMNKMKTSERCTATGFHIKHESYHTMGTPSYSWAENNSSCVATASCATEGCVHSEQTTSTSVQNIVSRPPTCVAPGDTKYIASFNSPWAKSTSKIVTGNIPETGHEMGIAEYVWSLDGKQCTVVRKCTHNGCEYTESFQGTMASSVVKQPTCTEKGQTKYDATFAVDWAVPQSKTMTDIAANGHTWQDVWSKDGVNHWHECSVCHTHKDETAHTWNAGEITKPATYEEAGVRTYTCTACGQQKTETIPMMQHELGEVTYNWASDGKSCTAIKKCIHEGCDYSEQAVANISSEVNKAATCGVAGDTKYTATFVESWVSEQTKIVVGDIPATGKHVYDDEFDKECNVCGQKRSIDNEKGQEGENNIPVVLTTVAHTFSVTVPTSLPISVAADGAISCADAASCKVVNNEEGPVDIKSVTLSGDNQWVIVPASTAMESEAVNSKKLAMTVMGYETNDGGLNTASFAAQTINGNADFGIIYTAKLPTQTVETDKAPVANVVFTIGWHEAA